MAVANGAAREVSGARGGEAVAARTWTAWGGPDRPRVPVRRNAGKLEISYSSCEFSSLDIHRSSLATVLARLAAAPVVLLLGARQVGKTTLARAVGATWDGPVHHLDLEDPADAVRLTESGLALRPLKGLVVLDEVQRMPELFALLRVLADRRPLPRKALCPAYTLS